ncbi:MAG: formate transporter FocA [Bacteriovoracaceae bacterium]|jgi:formate transporter|nr:formate transporter FocA [Bacteriovoracaceae bacterium]
MPMNDLQHGIDALMPPQMAEKAEALGVKKAHLAWDKVFALSILAGAFISLGAVFATTVTAGGAGVIPFGILKLLAGFVFCLGLVLVVVAGAELFTGNNLIVLAWANGKITFLQVLKNWVIVYIGNFVGCILTAIGIFLSGQYKFGQGIVGVNILKIANVKTSLDFVEAFMLGVFCNALVCLAVWLTLSARSTTDRILAVIFPITAFVAAGFEHSIANMYFIGIGLLVKFYAGAKFWAMTQLAGDSFESLNMVNFFLVNLVPVTLGNIVGGSVMVGLIYWVIYIRKS